MSSLQGGKFGHGFVSAGVTEALAPQLDAIEHPAAGVVAAAVVGGTVSELTGGSFSNGAMTAAFSRAFNQLTHELSQNYSPEKPYHHEYEGEWAVCTSGQEWCTQQRGFESLKHFAYPGQDNSIPVWDRKVSEVFFGGSSAGHIQTRLEPSTFSIFNTTRPDHIFHDGFVHRSLIWRDETLYLRTYGAGNNQNFYRWAQNVALWRPAFNQYNYQFKQHMIQSWIKEQP